MQTSSNSIPTDTQVNPLNFTNVSTLQDLNTHKSYVPIAGCVLEHILYNNQFSNIEKLNYILSDSIAPINYSRDAQRTSTLSAKQWGKILNCSKTKAFAAQKNLEEKGYFVIQRSTNKQGRNKNNIITPTLPNQVFAALSKTSEKWGSKVTSYTPSDKSKRAYLDRTKLFIPLNYQFLKLIASNNHLSSFAKVLLINFYCSWHKCHVATTNDNNKQDRLENNSSSNSFIISYEQLMTCFNCNKSTLSRAILMLQNLGFINKKRFFVRNDDKDDNRHDKSLWTISLLLPSSIQQELTKQKDRASSSSSYITKNRQYSLVKDSLDADSTPAIITEIAHTDPYVANSGQYYNKEEKINIKNIDSIDAKSHFLEKYENLQNCKFLSELSKFYKNSLEEEQKETLLEKEQKIVSITLPTINTQESFLEVEIYKEISSSVAKDKLESTKKVEEEQEEISETVREEQEKTLPLNQLREQSEEEQSNCAMGNSLVNTTSEIAVATASIVYHKKSSNQNKARTTTKFQGKSLKSFYPLTKEQVDKLNQLSSREFSNNFANQLLLKLYIRDPNKTFASTNHMIAYMSKAFRYEKHQAPLVNHETFRFTANVSDPESVEIRQKEKYLTEVEYSIDTSYSSQLRKKIAGMFETKLAYQILTEVKFDYHATKYQTTSQELEITNDDWQNLELSEENNITQFEHVLDDHSTCYVDSSLSLASKHDVANIDYDNQLSTNVTEENDQIKTSLVMTENDDINYDINDKIVTRELSELSLKSSLPARQLTRIILANTCTIKLPRDLALTNNQQQNLENAIVAVYGYVKIVYQQLPATYKKLSSSRLPDEIFLADLDQNSVWYKIRKKLIDNFDEHIDKAWFSKLRAEEDAITQKLTLIAPTNFLRDWINNKYGSVIKDIAKKLDYQFVELITKKQSLCNVV